MGGRGLASGNEVEDVRQCPPSPRHRDFSLGGMPGGPRPRSAPTDLELVGISCETCIVVEVGLRVGVEELSAFSEDHVRDEAVRWIHLRAIADEGPRIGSTSSCGRFIRMLGSSGS